MSTVRFPARTTISQENGFVGETGILTMLTSLESNFALVNPSVDYDDAAKQLVIQFQIEVPAEFDDPSEFAFEVMKEAVFKAMRAVDPDLHSLDGTEI